jgi:hypothetical protein
MMLYIDRGCHESVLIESDGKRYRVTVIQISVESGAAGVVVIEGSDGRRWAMCPGEVIDLPCGQVELMMGGVKISSDRERVANGTARLLFNAPRNIKIWRPEKGYLHDAI